MQVGLSFLWTCCCCISRATSRARERIEQEKKGREREKEKRAKSVILVLLSSSTCFLFSSSLLQLCTPLLHLSNVNSPSIPSFFLSFVTKAYAQSSIMLRGIFFSSDRPLFQMDGTRIGKNERLKSSLKKTTNPVSCRAIASKSFANQRHKSSDFLLCSLSLSTCLLA